MKKSIFSFSVRDMVEIAMLCALAIVLDTFVKIQIGKSGGSINIAMLPLFIVALRHGWFKGLIAGGVVFGLITCLIDGYGIITYPLEYLLAYGCVAILGVFANYINKSFNEGTKKGVILSIVVLIEVVALCAVIRMIGGTIDSMWLWEYEFGPAIGYNASYVFPSALAVAILLVLLMPYLKVINKQHPTSFLKD